MPEISLITSAYRTDAYLAAYLGHVTRLVGECSRDLQVVMVVNDATPNERETLETHAADWLKVLHVPLESVYASWNRGVLAADADILGFWNVDDVRTTAGLETGCELLTGGYDLVDFAFQYDRNGKPDIRKAQYRPDDLSPKTTLSPFWMYRRELYDAAGQFDDAFKIVGDFEWSKRPAVRHARFIASDCVAGTFSQRGDNLSGSGRPLEWVEYNIALIWHRGLEHLRPVDPDLMRQTWYEWGDKHGDIDPRVADWLWGRDANQRYTAYTRERRLHPLLLRIMLALARRGLIKSAVWDAHSKSW